MPASRALLPRPSVRILTLATMRLALSLPTPTLAAQTTPPPNPPTQAAQSLQLDINTATVADLKALPGMGPAYARRVIENRPYTAKNQLVTRGVLPQNVYEGIRDRIVAHRMQIR